MRTAQKSGSRRRQRLLAIDWQDCGWRPVIAVQFPRAEAAKMSNGARASARFKLRSNGMLQCLAGFRFVHRSGVNAVLRVHTGSLPTGAGFSKTAPIFNNVPFPTP
jgi:hypothetical protein